MPFKLRSNPDLNFHEDSSVEAHLRRILVVCLKGFQITLEESAEITLILVKIPAEKYFVLDFFPAIEIVLEFTKYCLIWFVLSSFIYLYVLPVSTISLHITISTC